MLTTSPAYKLSSRAATEHAASCEFTLAKDLEFELKILSSKLKVSDSQILLTAFDIFLQRYTHQDVLELVVKEPEFANAWVLQTEINPAASFIDVLDKVQQSLLAVSNNTQPAQATLSPSAAQSRMLFILRSVQEASDSPLSLQFAGIEFDLILEFTESVEGLAGRFIYAADYFDPTHISHRIDNFQTLLAGITVQLEAPIATLPLLGEAERKMVLHTWNATQAAYPEQLCTHQLFEAQAVKTPEGIAVIYQQQNLSYAELNAQANQLARHLRQLGIGVGQQVGICAGRALPMVVGVLATLKAGAACVPLDPTYPRNRLGFILENSAPAILLTEARAQHILTGLADTIPQIDLETDRHLWSAQSDSNLSQDETGVQPDNLIYIIYTSGSTGNPKGVEMHHAALVNLVAWQKDNSQLAFGARTLQFSPINFDVSFQELFSTWHTGGTLVLIDDEVRRDPEQLLQFLDKEHIARLFLPFIPLEQLANFGVDLQLFPAQLREIITAGEQLRVTPRFKMFFAGLNNCQLVNQYGPSETHVVTAFNMPKSFQQWEPLPSIGSPIANTQIYILDNHGQPVPTGVSGEIYLAGIGVAHGYRERPDLTAERFLPNPYGEPGSKMYKTGDLGRWLADDNIEFLGRNDFQVKIRGFRIELGEIESALSLYPGLREVVVVVREYSSDKRLVAYYTGEIEPSAEEFRALLIATLPDYMVPAAYVHLDALPLTVNGKVDRLNLPLPGSITHVEKDYDTQYNEAEKKLLAIWADILETGQVGLTDNFFDLGGNSILAVSLLYKVNKAFHTKLSLATIFNTPTIAHMAKLLTGDTDIKQHYSVFKVLEGNDQAPVFWFEYSNTDNVVVSDLRIQQPIYGLRYAIGEAKNNHTKLPASVEALATHYIEQIRQIQPKGPYYLMGHSFGGLLAYESAIQLSLQGEEVKFLCLLDTTPPNLVVKYFPLLTIINNFAQVSWNEYRLQFKKHLTFKNIYEKIKYCFVSPIYDYEKFNLELILPLMHKYPAKSYAGDLVYIKAEGIDKKLSKNIENYEEGWNRLTEKPIKLFTVPGNHFEILSKSSKQTAEAISQVINDLGLFNQKNGLSRDTPGALDISGLQPKYRFQIRQ